MQKTAGNIAWVESKGYQIHLDGRENHVLRESAGIILKEVGELRSEDRKQL